MAKYKLEDVCEFITDGTHQTPEYCEENGVIFLSSKDVTERRINWDDVKFIPQELHEQLHKRLSPQRNDILLAKNGTTGVAALVDRDEVFDVYVSLAVLRPKESIFPRYLLYAINSPVAKRQFNAGLKGIGVPNLHLSVIRKTELSIAPREEQEVIVKILDTLSNIIDRRKAELDDLDELIKARFVELFGDILRDKNLPLVQLSELADIGSSKRIYANEYVEEGIPFYRSKEIRELGSGLRPSVELFIKHERYDEIKEKFGVPKVGDILIAAIGATIGYSWIVNTENPFYYKDGNLIILSIKDGVNPIFLNHTMGILIEDFKNKGVAGSAQLALTIEKLEKMMVVNPDIELQNQFAEFVKQVDKSKVAVQKSQDETQKLFDSLMQEYFG